MSKGNTASHHLQYQQNADSPPITRAARAREFAPGRDASIPVGHGLMAE
jgi:hypothetical protein